MDEKLEALKEAHKYVKLLYVGIEEAIGCFRKGNNEQGYKLTVQIADGLEWLLNVLKLTEDIQVEKISQTNLLQILQQVIEAMENKDTLLLADLLEFELLDQITAWQSKLEANIMHYNS